MTGRSGPGAGDLAASLEAVELLGFALAGGSTIRVAIAEVVPWCRGSAESMLREVVERTTSGAALTEALRAAAVGRSRPLRRLSGVLHAAACGAPVLAPIEQLATELRAARRRELEARARRVPVRLLLPLVGGVLPAFCLVAVVPLVATSLVGLTLPG
jgi:hypothetical protein